ncbi:MAG TPA: glycosyltransferase [Candidatus Methylacidiphilales bacterium]|jgi:UDP:flavonoid glycosyltransferase YjiC (YdhE family)|nr:glycosyltransferase [Candidatus Methylacidiphilales bacterium]
MRFLLSSWGSHGDLHPFLALGRGLIARGHEATLVGHPDWGVETEAAGLRFVSTGEPSREDFIRDHPEVMSMKWGGLVSLHTLVNRAIAPGFPHTMEALLAEARAHDVIVAHHFAFPAPVVAELTGLPWATVTLAPGVVPSAYSLPAANFGRAGHRFFGRARNRFIWSAGRMISRVMVDPVVNRLRAKHGLRPVRDAIFEAHSPVLNLQLYSEHFAPRPTDWSAEKRIAGFCHHDPPGAALPPEIETFLDRGEPPVLFTLGSVAVQQPGAFYPGAVEALEALGLRGILLIGLEKNRPARLPGTILAVPYLPYGLLMPRVRAVAHQCGIGTLSHALRAGAPSVACPFAFDQPNNARRLEALGVAEVVLPHQRDARHIGRALERLLAGDAPARAQRLGGLIRAENGVARGCGILEETFGWCGGR